MIENIFPHSSYAYIKYDPPRQGMKKRTNWWCVATIDREITRYYRVQLENRYGLKIYAPSWDAHASVIRGEKPKPSLMHLWKKYDGKKVKFTYSHIVYPNTQGKFFAIKIKCPELITIRQEFGLPSDWDLHLTVGRIYDSLDAIALKMLYKDKE